MMFESEEYRIVRRIKDFVKSNKNIFYKYEIMLRNKRILRFADYYKMVKSGKINPNDAYVEIGIGGSLFKSEFYYPFLDQAYVLLVAYLSKLGFYSRFFIVPATGLKYIAHVERYEKYLAIELVNLDTAVNNTNLRTITFVVVGEKLVNGENKLTDEEEKKIGQMFSSQRLFAGYNFDEAIEIIKDYYRGNKSLVNEVVRIATDYYRLFQPYRVCYDMKKWKEIDCWSIKLD